MLYLVIWNDGIKIKDWKWTEKMKVIKVLKCCNCKVSFFSFFNSVIGVCSIGPKPLDPKISPEINLTF